MRPKALDELVAELNRLFACLRVLEEYYNRPRCLHPNLIFCRICPGLRGDYLRGYI
jgi:hypothetical protein